MSSIGSIHSETILTSTAERPLSTMADDPELELLLSAPTPTSGAPLSIVHSRKTAPVITGDALDAAGSSTFPQRALYGQVVSQKAEDFPEKPTNRKLYINSNAPFSALLCGVQVCRSAQFSIHCGDC